MIEVHIEDRWDLQQKNVYVIDRTHSNIFLFNNEGLHQLDPGIGFMGLEPTFIIKDEWLEQLIEKLDPMIERTSDDLSVTLWVERNRVDKMINYLIGYEDG